MKSTKTIAWILGPILIAGGARAQTARELEYGSTLTWGSTEVSHGPLARTAPLGFFPCLPSDDASSERPILLREPFPITRETLGDEGETLHRYDTLPGGIVLGTSACVPAELGGARLAFDEAGALGLRLHGGVDGAFLRAPAISPTSLRACARFVRNGLDGLVDIVSADGIQPRLAPAFEGSELAELLVRMDRVPHGVLPETRPWKTLIVDRAARVEVRDGELVFGADLEVRCYDGDGSGWARCVRTIEAPGPAFVGPRRSPDPSAELSPLSELAGWLAFLRWARSADPRGFAELCEESGPAAHAAPSARAL